MIDKMAEAYFDTMLPPGIEFSSGPLIEPAANDNDRLFNDKFFQQDYHMLSDDHWKKFELDFPELSNIDDIFKELDCGNNANNWLLDFDNKDCLFLNHDCMWAGHCSSKEHAEEPRSGLGCIVPKPPVLKKEMCPPPPVVKSAGMGQQSLLKPSVKAANTTTTTFVPANTTVNMIQHTPQTPPESDDEENKAHTTTLLKILNDAINECDLDDDSDLCEYFEDKGVDVKEETIDIKEEPVDIKIESEDIESAESEQDDMNYQQFRKSTLMAAVNDHSYHKDKNAVMRHNNYGLDTPSDSEEEEEEEIDVVSVSDKLSSNASRMALSLPTNPSSRDRHQLQRRVATAISRKRMNNGIKTILPVRSTDATPSSSSSASSTRSRGTKRGRGSRSNASYKRRKTNNMDGEREPSDKRHLHNDMERQRRVDLRIAFENLKAVVPEVSGTKKIAKVNILLQAAQYCYYLTSTSINHTKQMEDLRRKQVWLRSRVSQLRRNLAARR